MDPDSGRVGFQPHKIATEPVLLPVCEPNYLQGRKLSYSLVTHEKRTLFEKESLCKEFPAFSTA
jgi:hypothetical protein